MFLFLNWKFDNHIVNFPKVVPWDWKAGLRCHWEMRWIRKYLGDRNFEWNPSTLQGIGTDEHTKETSYINSVDKAPPRHKRHADADHRDANANASYYRILTAPNCTEPEYPNGSDDDIRAHSFLSSVAYNCCTTSIATLSLNSLSATNKILNRQEAYSES